MTDKPIMWKEGRKEGSAQGVKSVLEESSDRLKELKMVKDKNIKNREEDK